MHWYIPMDDRHLNIQDKLTFSSPTQIMIIKHAKFNKMKIINGQISNKTKIWSALITESVNMTNFLNKSAKF